MERVKKGERYWCVVYTSKYGFIAVDYIDMDDETDILNYGRGNYFATFEEAEAMAEKIRKVLKGAWVLTPPEGEILSRKVEAVLNGAEVIEMPSEEEIEKVSHRRCRTWDGLYYPDSAKGFSIGIEWLKSKIIK